MAAAVVILTVLTAATAVACMAAGVSLIARTTRSPVARHVCRLFLGIETDDLHGYLEQLFEAHARAVHDGERMTIARYSRLLRRAGYGVVALGVLLLAFLAYVLTLLAAFVP